MGIGLIIIKFFILEILTSYFRNYELFGGNELLEMFHVMGSIFLNRDSERVLATYITIINL